MSNHTFLITTMKEIIQQINNFGLKSKGNFHKNQQF